MRHLAYITGSALVIGALAVSPILESAQKQQAVIPAGTTIEVRLNSELDTGEAKAGQTFTGTVAQPVIVGGKTVLARGTTVRGRITEVVSSGRLKRPASITLVLTSHATQPLQIDGKSHLLRNIALIGGGAGAGAAIGGATGGKKGAAVGAAIGAGAGTATAYLTGKNEIVLPVEAVLPFVTGSAGAATPATASTTASQTAEARRDQAVPGAVQPSASMVPTAVFSERDRQIIRRYYSGGSSGLPPGLAKRGGKLPPGLEKQLRKNGTLPPGLQKRVEPFPTDLVRQLPPVPAGHSRVILEGRAIILDGANRILDLFLLNR